jgi:polysaccharide export outer membrane protein
LTDFAIHWARRLAALVFMALAAGCATEAPRSELRDVSATPSRAKAPAWRKPGVLGPGDQLDIFVWGYPDYTKRATVSSSGTLPHPMLGDLPVAGKTMTEAQDVVRAALTDYIKDPVVRVTLAANRSQRIHVLGEVVRPGVYPIAEFDTSLVEAVSLAGGLTIDARESNIMVVRDVGKQVEVQTLDFRRIAQEGDLAGNVALREGDIIYVPASRSADIAREASRLSQVVGALLVLQNATILFQPFLNALIHGTTTSTGNPVVVPN